MCATLLLVLLLSQAKTRELDRVFEKFASIEDEAAALFA
jgi:hypothetical protein